MVKHNRSVPISLVIFFSALCVRLIYAFVCHRYYPFIDHPSSDVRYYQLWAEQIAFGGGSPATAFAGLPLYPYFLAMLKRLTLNSDLAVRMAHLLLGSLNCLLTYHLAEKVFDRKVGLMAGVLACLNFTLIYYDWLMMPVTLLITLTLLILIVLCDHKPPQTVRDWLILGFLCGLGAVGDGKFFFVVALLLIAFLFRSGKSGPATKRAMGVCLPFVLGFLTVVTTVTVRNRVVSGDWILVTSQSGLSLYAGNNPHATGVYENPDFIRPDHRGQDEDQQLIARALSQKKLGPAEVSQFWQNQALKFMRENPGDFARLLGTKARLFLTETERAFDLDLLLQREWREAWDFNPYRVMLPLALIGLIVAVRTRNPHRMYLNIFLVSQLIFTVIFFLTNRHRASVLPLLIIYECAAVLWLIRSLRHRQWKGPALAVLVVVLFTQTFQFVPIDRESLRFIELSKRGVKELANEQWPQAKDTFIAALAIRPHDTNTLYNLGNSYLSMNDLPAAREAYQQALLTCDYNVDAMFNLAYTLTQLGDEERALQLYEKILTYAPKSLDVHYRMALIYFQQQRCPDVARQTRAILELEPSLGPQLRPLFQSCLSESDF